MSASVTNDKITQTMSGGNPVATTVSSARSIGGTSLSVVSTTNWPTITAVYFVTYQKKTDGSIDTSTLCSWKATVSGTTLGSLALKNGTDAGNAEGDYVEMGPTAAWAEGIYEWATTSNNTDGTLKDGIVSTAKVANSAITTAKIAAGNVTTNTLADSAVTASKIDFTTLATRKSVDANGWTVYDFGAWKEYTKIGSGVSVDALGNLGASTVNYPTGVSMTDVVSGVATMLAVLVSEDPRTDERRVTFSTKLTSEAISCGIQNNGASGQWFTGRAHFRIIK